jgi:hypothetical protein
VLGKVSHNSIFFLSLVNSKQTVSFKPMSLPGCLIPGFGWGGAVGGDGFGVGGSLVDGGGGRLIGVCPPCMVFSGQSRLAEVHFGWKRLYRYDGVVGAE